MQATEATTTPPTSTPSTPVTPPTTPITPTTPLTPTTLLTPKTTTIAEEITTTIIEATATTTISEKATTTTITEQLTTTTIEEDITTTLTEETETVAIADEETTTTTSTTTTAADEQKEFANKVTELSAWFAQNANLPEKIEPILLKRFLKCVHGDVAAAKRVIELNYAMRNKHAHVYIERDPQDKQFNISREANTAAPVPGLTPERYKIFCYRLEEVDAAVVNNAEELKIFYMLSDSRFSLPDCDDADDELNNLADGDVQIMDIKNFTMRHVARISFLLLRMHMKFLQEAYPVRLKAMHIINCPSIFDKMLALVKPFIREDVFQMIHFHTNGLESLYDYVPKDMLPEDYGGKAPKLLDLKAKWTQIIQDKRDYLMDAKYWRTAEGDVKRSRWGWW